MPGWWLIMWWSGTQLLIIFAVTWRTSPVAYGMNSNIFVNSLQALSNKNLNFVYSCFAMSPLHQEEYFPRFTPSCWLRRRVENLSQEATHPWQCPTKNPLLQNLQHTRRSVGVWKPVSHYWKLLFKIIISVIYRANWLCWKDFSFQITNKMNGNVNGATPTSGASPTLSSAMAVANKTPNSAANATAGQNFFQ